MINFDNFDIEEHNYNFDIDKYTNKEPRYISSVFDYCIKVSKQDIDILIDILSEHGFSCNGGQSVYSKDIFKIHEDGYYYIALFIGDYGRKKIINSVNCFEIIKFR